jgi:hypothetical protein
MSGSGMADGTSVARAALSLAMSVLCVRALLRRRSAAPAPGSRAGDRCRGSRRCYVP